jgi:hypothetical protein
MAQSPELTTAVKAKPASATGKTPRKPAATKPPQKATPKPAQKPVVQPKKAVPPVAKAGRSVKPVKAKKLRLVRDSFTIPEAEHALIGGLKKRCLAAGVAARKSELLRAAIFCLADLDDRAVLIALKRLATIKTGRPAKAKK